MKKLLSIASAGLLMFGAGVSALACESKNCEECAPKSEIQIMQEQINNLESHVNELNMRAKLMDKLMQEVFSAAVNVMMNANNISCNV